jgi:hypothetical protein
MINAEVSAEQFGGMILCELQFGSIDEKRAATHPISAQRDMMR